MTRDEEDEETDTEPSKKKYVILLFIFAGGSVLVGLGVALTYAGLFIPHPSGDQTPGLITGPTCVALGAVAIFLSVDDYRRQRRIWASLEPAPGVIYSLGPATVPLCCKEGVATHGSLIKVMPHKATSRSDFRGHSRVVYSARGDRPVVLDVSRLGRDYQNRVVSEPHF